MAKLKKKLTAAQEAKQKARRKLKRAKANDAPKSKVQSLRIAKRDATKKVQKVSDKVAAAKGTKVQKKVAGNAFLTNKGQLKTRKATDAFQRLNIGPANLKRLKGQGFSGGRLDKAKALRQAMNLTGTKTKPVTGGSKLASFDILTSEPHVGSPRGAYNPTATGIDLYGKGKVPSKLLKAKKNNNGKGNNGKGNNAQSATAAEAAAITAGNAALREGFSGGSLDSALATPTPAAQFTMPTFDEALGVQDGVVDYISQLEQLAYGGANEGGPPDPFATGNAAAFEAQMRFQDELSALQQALGEQQYAYENQLAMVQGNSELTAAQYQTQMQAMDQQYQAQLGSVLGDATTMASVYEAQLADAYAGQDQLAAEMAAAAAQQAEMDALLQKQQQEAEALANAFVPAPEPGAVAPQIGDARARSKRRRPQATNTISRLSIPTPMGMSGNAFYGLQIA